MDHVDITLHQWRSTLFEWGQRDCLLSIADYLIEPTGIDHGAIFRGTYSDEAGAAAHIRAYGGERRLLDRTGLQHVTRPTRGDILLIHLARPIAAICTGPGAAARLEVGVKEIELRFVRVLCSWKVPECLPLSV